MSENQIPSTSVALRRSARIREQNVALAAAASTKAAAQRIKKPRSSDESNGPDCSLMSLILPEHILQCVLFFLPVEDAVPLTVVSKTWKSAWKSLPSKAFLFELASSNNVGFAEFAKSVDKSLKFLTEHKTLVDSFVLKMTLSPIGMGLDLNYVYHSLDQWISLLMRNYVNEIDIRILNSNNHLYVLPINFFTMRSVIKLHLEGCKFLPVMLFTIRDERKLGFYHNFIKELTLTNIDAVEDQIQTLINYTRLFVEKLTIKSCPSVESLFLDTYPNLTTLEVDVKALKIRRSPNLETLILFGIKKVRVFGSPNLTTLRCLTWDVHHGYKSIEKLVAKLRNLETLDLFLTHHEMIRVRSRSLKNLTVDQVEPFEMPLEVELETPKLSKFYFSGRNMPLVRTIVTIVNFDQFEDGVKLHHLGDPTWGIDGVHLHELGKFTGSFGHQRVEIFLNNIVTTNLLGMEELKDLPVMYHPSNVGAMILQRIPSSNNNFSSFLNCLFWSCHPSSLLVLMTTEENRNSPHRDAFLKYMCDELLNNKINFKAVCCGGYNNASKCWRHYVTDVKSIVYKTTNYEDDIQLPHQLIQHEGVIINSSNNGIVVGFNFHWLPNVILPFLVS